MNLPDKIEPAKKQYDEYRQRVEADNLARDMYDGDTYMGYEDPMTFIEWKKSQSSPFNNGEHSAGTKPSKQCVYPKTELTNELHNKNTELHNNSGENTEKVTSLTNDKIDVKELKSRVNSLLSSMQVEEYGLIPQPETLDCIMRQIDLYAKSLIHQAEITALTDIKAKSYKLIDTAIGETLHLCDAVYVSDIDKAIEALEKEIVA